MVTTQSIEEQLTKIGFDFRFWGRSEVKELNHVLADDETIQQCVNGHYQGGFAMLVATNRRLLLIDHKPMFLTIEAIWYDKIGQVDYNHRLMNATLCITGYNKDLNFTSWNHARLREILLYSQEMMIEAKQGNERSDPQKISEADEITQPEQPKIKEPQPFTTLDFPQAVYTNNQARSQFTARNLHFPINLPDELTLYAATRLPFSRRRYFAREN